MAEYKFPTEVVDLPSKGLLYPKDNPLSKGSVELKYMTAKEEDILTSINLIRKGIVIDKVLESLIVDKKVKVDDLLIGDKNALMIAARILGYGKEYNFTVYDEDGEQTTAKVDLTTLNDKEIDTKDLTQGVNEFQFKLPNSKRDANLRLLTHQDEKELEIEAERLKKVGGITQAMTSRMKRVIVSVDGKSERAHINNFVDKELLSVDALAIRKFINSVNPDVHMTTTATFEDGTEQEVAVEITAQFFWPSA